MKVILLNDTSSYHSGCSQVISVLSKFYKPYAFCKTGQNITKELIEDSDLVVLNGEGTLHHDAPNANKFLGYIKFAQELNKKTHIVNTVWQSMDPNWKSTLEKCEVVEVREVLSKNAIPCANARVCLDASIHTSKIVDTDVERKGVLVGGSFFGELLIDYPHEKIDIFKSNWYQLVNTCSRGQLVITGRHHEMYAAIMARTPVLVIQGNTWKNEGLFHTLNKTNLILEPSEKNINDILSGKYDSHWQDVWNYLDGYPFRYKPS